jgi:diguanylate cyclase (GGDEF)-like protein
MSIDQSVRLQNETGVVNGAEFRVLAAHELDRSRRDGRHLSVLWLRIDRRGPVNLDEATVGRGEVRELAELLGLELRKSDVVGITGERELAVLLPDTAPGQVNVVIGHLQETVLELGASAPTPLIARVGTATYDPSGTDLALTALFAQARASLTAHR